MNKLEDIYSFPFYNKVLRLLHIDPLMMVGLEEELKGFDIVHTLETNVIHVKQCIAAKKKGFVKKVILTVTSKQERNLLFNTQIRNIFIRDIFPHIDHFVIYDRDIRDFLLMMRINRKKISYMHKNQSIQQNKHQTIIKTAMLLDEAYRKLLKVPILRS